MSKKYNVIGKAQFDQVTSDQVNANTREPISTFNGHLDSQNMPIDSINNTKLSVPVVSTTASGSVNGIETIKWEGQTQAYYQIKHYSGIEGQINDLLADTQVDLSGSNWSSGWNNLTDQTPFQNFYFNADMKEGMLNGHFIIDFNRGLQSFNDGSAISVYGYDWWTRFGLFINNQLIADTGQCYPRGECLVVPWKMPIGSENITVEVKWQTITSKVLTGAGSFVGDPSTYLEIYGCSVWFCNTYK